MKAFVLLGAGLTVGSMNLRTLWALGLFAAMGLLLAAGLVYAQVVFGASVAAVYGLLVTAHVVFGLFFALTIVTAARGALLFVRGLLGHVAEPQAPPRLAIDVAAEQSEA